MAVQQASQIVSSVKISRVYVALTGTDPRQSGEDRYRGAATWRDGENPNVTLNDARGTWYDHGTNQGGGVLDLIVRVHGGSRQDALRWLSAYSGVPLQPAGPGEITRMRESRESIERDLPDARLWKRSEIEHASTRLDELSQMLGTFKGLSPEEAAETAALTQTLAALRAHKDSALVDAYRDARARDPEGVEQIVRAERLADAQISRLLATATITRDAALRREAELMLAQQRTERDLLANMTPNRSPDPRRRSEYELKELGMMDALMEEVLIHEQLTKGTTMNERQNLKPAAQLTNEELRTEDRALHNRYEQLAQRYEQAPAQERAEIRQEMQPIVNREREIRNEFKDRLAPEVAVTDDRVPQPQIAYAR